jgi:hypothetical protein
MFERTCCAHVQIMGGCESDMFRYFKVLLFKGFLAARKVTRERLHLTVSTWTGLLFP